MAKAKVVAAVAGLAIETVKAHALEMLALVDQAEQAKQDVIETASLVGVLQKIDDGARADLVAAINEASAGAAN